MCGGVGVTPMMSLLCDLMDRIDANDQKLELLQKVVGVGVGVGAGAGV